LLTLLGAHPIFHISRIRVNVCVCIFSEIVILYILLGLLCIGRMMEALLVNIWLSMEIVNVSVLNL
jgi:hypothetical protein